MNDRVAPSLAPPLAPPLAMLMELTHRCPLKCPYCSNPLALERARDELDTATWKRVISEAAGIGILQAHFSGGEPMVRSDLPELVRHARAEGLYTNLITSAVLLNAARMAELADAGLDHVQISFQGADAAVADHVAGFRDAHEKKLAAAQLVRDAGLALTLNAVVHRQNLHQLSAMIDLAVDAGAQRIEVAHVQYYGWALKNRAALIPTRAQLDEATRIVTAARANLAGTLTIDYVVPDYYAARPKACMGGWARQFFNITPSGKMLPCHAAETLPGLVFERVTERSVGDIWAHSSAFEKYRGTSWMAPPCQGCARAEIDWGGCRCQALALTGDAGATDPACGLSPDHAMMAALAIAESGEAVDDFAYRMIS
ncbi:MAG: pyrroloquinoline quinone biosynthesis protein PqqE [Acidiphilium sp. 37-64-53]|uniref:pyrroloquinoline quinone biosynthesis protein PqqE n=1 Tax=Acidiphilium TaxID=522 RepID=UPI000BD18394|nr:MULTISPECIES: pyrroloquinoline quinone biosynthesis protein PqqE [Acidiphilium]OYW03937.1 MAG: pyrroloquinoline quinone biosynthesis protein PqqE [Acidiphilium sp. 37-64-53]OZB27016.1 MAG: pyrroloquinoline quinone biosynthesis protein PqqE [Acidiphilium sp. 34-64-41]HQT83871.1 pyrroloquinoline quinone biosynthesis protein PqqE [Acidiphilium rubrum]